MRKLHLIVVSLLLLLPFTGKAFKEDAFLFRENKGQWEDNIRFTAHTGNAHVTFLNNTISFAFSRESETQAIARDNGTESNTTEMLVWNINLLNAQPSPAISGGKKRRAIANYINHRGTYSHVPDYAELNYKSIYPGIDLKYYSSDNKLKYDFIVQPGGRVEDIKLACEGVEGLNIARSGDLEVKTAWGTLLEKKPYCYQIVDGIKITVRSEFMLLNDSTYTFNILGEYNKNAPLIIDPVQLVYGTHVGGTGSTISYQYDIDIDNNENVYGTGYAQATFPVTAGSYDATFNGNTDAFVYKLSADATNIIYATYIGGNDQEKGYGIIVNRNSNQVFVTGVTYSANFPTTGGAYDSGANGQTDIFVARLNATGTNAVYISRIGGSEVEMGFGITLVNNNEALIAGYTNSPDFPASPTAYQTTFAGSRDGVVAKLNNTGTNLSFATYFGGSALDEAESIDTDNAGNIYVWGGGNSTDLPTTPGVIAPNALGQNDHYLAKFNNDCSTLIAGTYIGGNYNETTRDGTIEVTGAGEVYFAASTGSDNLPFTPGAVITTLPIGKQGYAGKILPDFSAYEYLTYIGGSGTDNCTDLAVNSSGEAFIIGWVNSTDMPVTQCAYQSQIVVNPNIQRTYDIYLCKLNNTGTNILFGTYYGGDNNDYTTPRVCVIYDQQGCERDVIFGFTTHSSDVPTTPGVVQPTKRNGDEDQPFVARFTPEEPVADFNFNINNGGCQGGATVDFTDMSNGQCVWEQNWQASSWEWDFGDGSAVSNEQNPSHTYTANGQYTVRLIVGCPSDTIEKVVDITGTGTELLIDLGPDTTQCDTANITLDAGVVAGATYTWNTGETTQTITVDTPGTYIVEVDDGNCTGSDTIDVDFIDCGCPASVDLGNDTAICPVDSVVLDAGPGNTYLWSNGATTQTITVKDSGTYSVQITTPQGCTANDEIVVSLLPSPLVNIGNDTSFCAGDSVILDAGFPGATYLWNTGETTQTIVAKDSGDYSVIVTSGGGCSGVDTALVVVTSEPLVNLGSESTLCKGDTLTLDAGFPGANYIWNTDETSQTIAVTESGTYYVDVDLNGCMGTDTIEVSFRPIIILVDDTTACGDSILLDAGPVQNGGYQWSTGETTQTIWVSGSDRYKVVVTDGGCNDSAFAVVSLLDSVQDFSFGNDTSLCFDDSLTLNAGHPEAVWSTGVTGSSITVNSEGTYWAMVSNECGEAGDTIVIDCFTSFYVPNTFTPNGDGNNETFNGSGENIVEYEMWVFDRWGLGIFYTDDVTIGWDGKVQGSNLPAQEDTYVYVVKMTDGLGKNRRFVGHVNLVR